PNRRHPGFAWQPAPAARGICRGAQGGRPEGYDPLLARLRHCRRVRPIGAARAPSGYADRLNIAMEGACESFPPLGHELRYSVADATVRRDTCAWHDIGPESESR